MAGLGGVDWAGLLAWSTNHHDGTAPSQFKPLSEEMRGHLEGAIADMMAQIEDPNKILEEAVQKIEEGRQGPNVPLLLTALELVDQCCDDPDACRNLCKLGGLVLLELRGFPDPEVRQKALHLLGLMLANNADAQGPALEKGALEQLRAQLKDTPEPQALGALSALVKGCAEAEARFCAEGGVEDVAPLLGGEDLKLCQKAATLLRVLLAHGRLQPAQAQVCAGAVDSVYTDAAFARWAEELQVWESVADLALACKQGGHAPTGVGKRLAWCQAHGGCEVEQEVLRQV